MSEQTNTPSPRAPRHGLRALGGAIFLACLVALVAVWPGATAIGQETGPETETAVDSSTDSSADAAAAGDAATGATGDEAASPSVYEGGDGEAEEMEIFVDTVDVRVVNVDVYVTDKKGNRITGLTKDDFELFEDRRPVEITNFYAMEEGMPVEEPGAETEEAEAVEETEAAAPLPLTAREERAQELPAEQRLFLVIYVDNFNIHPLNRNRVLDDLGYFLSSEVQRGDQVMLVTYDRSLHVRRPFTAEPAAIARSLEELEKLTGHAPSRAEERRQALERIGEARSPGQAAAYARMHAESVQNDLRFSLGALRELLDQLSGLPGRKALLYVSDGLPMVPGQDLFYAVPGGRGGATAITDSFQYDASRQFDQLTNAANANRVTFYTIDAAGLRLASSFSAENANPSVNLQVDSMYNSNLQSPLRYMAEETGGVAVVNTNRILPRMATIADDFNTYYSLGYSPARAGTGRYHDIRVEVKGRKDLVVRHRQGYRDKSVESQMTDGTLSALRFGFLNNPLNVRLAFDEPSRKDNRYYVVPVHVEVPLSEVVFVPRADGYEARLRLYLAALDREGDTSPVQQVPVPISIPADEMEHARGQLYRYTVPLLMRSGPHQVSVGVRDELASRESYVVDSVRVGEGRAGSPALSRRPGK